MAIQFFTDRIKIGDFTLFEGNGGLQFDGVARAENFNAFSFQGTVAGFTAGGSAPPETNVIDKFSFATDTNATDHGDLTQARRAASGQSSDVSGYTSGGYNPGGNFRNTVDKFPFAAAANATDVGDLISGVYHPAGQSSSVSGYVSGGLFPPSTRTNSIQKFPFATDTNAVDTADLTQGRQDVNGQSSATSGYTSGGFAPPYVNTIDKFPFATNANATDVGDLSNIKLGAAGQSSTSSGYASGGNAPFPSPPNINLNTIDKFPFATDSNATDIGDLSQVRATAAGQSSVGFGYTSGGTAPPFTNVIDKFPFSSDSNATDVGDLTQSRNLPVGTQD